MIDLEGFRSNVGIILSNNTGNVLWAKRINQESWQFPQGGIKPNESIEDALYRELKEEVGLYQKDVRILARTKGWLKYRLPNHLIREDSKPRCIGQKQKWFLLELLSEDSSIQLDNINPEFDQWMWVSYWYPLRQVIAFKKKVYSTALIELAPFLNIKE